MSSLRSREGEKKSKTMRPCRRQRSNLEGKITSMCSVRVLKHRPDLQ